MHLLLHEEALADWICVGDHHDQGQSLFMLSDLEGAGWRGTQKTEIQKMV